MDHDSTSASTGTGTGTSKKRSRVKAALDEEGQTEAPAKQARLDKDATRCFSSSSDSDQDALDSKVVRRARRRQDRERHRDVITHENGVGVDAAIAAGLDRGERLSVLGIPIPEALLIDRLAKEPLPQSEVVDDFARCRARLYYRMDDVVEVPLADLPCPDDWQTNRKGPLQLLAPVVQRMFDITTVKEDAEQIFTTGAPVGQLVSKLKELGWNEDGAREGPVGTRAVLCTREWLLFIGEEGAHVYARNIPNNKYP